MLIAQMTDIHIGFDPDARPEELNLARFRATLARVCSSPNLPDLMVLTGDLTDRGDRASFALLADLLRDAPCPVLPLVGNHDTREGFLTAFPERCNADGFVHHAAEFDGLVVICLDTLEPGRHGGAFCDRRRDWLRAALAASGTKPVAIFMHHPPVVSGIAWMDPAPHAPWIANFAAALAGHEQRIVGIRCGHLHRPLSTRFRGIPLGVTPSVAPLVALDLTAIHPDHADHRDLITAEPPSYALHRWDGVELVSHAESVGVWPVLASFDDRFLPLIREMSAERG